MRLLGLLTYLNTTKTESLKSFTDPRIQDLIIDSLEIGLNKKLLLASTGIDEETFDYKVEYNKFTHGEEKLIRKVIKDWRKANAIF